MAATGLVLARVRVTFPNLMIYHASFTLLYFPCLLIYMYLNSVCCVLFHVVTAVVIIAGLLDKVTGRTRPALAAGNLVQ